MRGFEPIAVGSYQGWIAPPHAAQIVDWIKGGQSGRTLKRGETRDVILLRGTDSVYIKRLRNDPGLIGRVSSRGVVRARREFRNLAFALEHDVPAPEPVALLVGPNDALIATRALEKSIVLKSLVAGRRLTREEVDPILDALARLCDTMVSVGLFHEEFDAARIMVSREPPAKLTLIDVESARIVGRALNEEEKTRMFARLVHSFVGFLPNQDVLRLMKRLGFVERAAQRKMVTQCRQVAFETARARSRRSVTAGPGFWREEPGRALFFGQHDFPIEQAFEHLRKLLTADRIKVLPRREVARTDEDVSAKVFLYGGVSGALRRGFTSEPGYNSWLNAHLLLACGIPTPQPHALVQEPGRTVFFQRWIKRATPMGDFVRRVFPEWDLRRRRNFLFRAARFIRRVHDRGIHHQDLKSNNILVRELPDRKLLFYVIDLDRIRHAPTIPREAVVSNLTQLNASVGKPLTFMERAWFLRSYIGWDSKMAAERKALAADVIKATLAKKSPYWKGGKP